MKRKADIVIDAKVTFRVDEKAKTCDTVEEAIKKGFIRLVAAECGSTAAEYGMAGRVDIEKVKQLALESLIKWEG